MMEESDSVPLKKPSDAAPSSRGEPDDSALSPLAFHTKNKRFDPVPATPRSEPGNRCGRDPADSAPRRDGRRTTEGRKRSGFRMREAKNLSGQAQAARNDDPIEQIEAELHEQCKDGGGDGAL